MLFLKPLLGVEGHSRRSAVSDALNNSDQSDSLTEAVAGDQQCSLIFSLLDIKIFLDKMQNFTETYSAITESTFVRKPFVSSYRNDDPTEV